MTVKSAEISDFDLIREHLAGSRDAFTQLVHRHVDMVYSAALRQVRDRHLADDVTQAVFLLLWQKAASLGPETIVSAWLYRTAGYCAANAMRVAKIRKRYESKAAGMASHETEFESSTANAELASVLDRAVARLPSADRAAVVMRYFEGRSAEDVGVALRVSPEAARKRVERAVVKLQEILRGFGVTTATPAIIGFLSRNAVTTSPPHVADAVKATLADPAAGSAAATIAKGAVIAMTAKTKSSAIAVIVLLLLIGGGTALIATSRRSGATTSSVKDIIRIQASIDGRSRLILRGNTVHWSNLEFLPPGQQNGSIFTYINGKPFSPKWTRVPLTPISVSDEFKELDPPLPVAPMTVTLNAIDARGSVRIVQQPKVANQYTLIIEFDDAATGGSADYTVDLTFRPAEKS